MKSIVMKNQGKKADQHFCGRRSDIIWNKKDKNQLPINIVQVIDRDWQKQMI